ncbi:hypothetical protein AAGS61_08005 [Lysinibacillus sp. KU-BSD001]|uniref:hypothetical protein n=1 Tax=Lysinibacillus sp. KU-BSD001 TaxID=3141328 RepID=UPI0036E68C4B
MKWLYSILLLILLTACGTESMNREKVENVTTQEVKEAPFTLRLVSEKAQYQVGEKIAVRAELVYDGEEEAIQIGHGGSWIWLETTNLTKDYQFGAAMNEPYIITPMRKGEVLIEPYYFSGSSYHEGMEGNSYTEDVLEQMSTLAFPVGQYEINGRTDFVIEGAQGEKYQLEAKVIFEVVE